LFFGPQFTATIIWEAVDVCCLWLLLVLACKGARTRTKQARTKEEAHKQQTSTTVMSVVCGLLL